MGQRPGLFITLEGGDGSGKTTQSNLLARWLSGQGYAVSTTREPGGTDVGLEIRELVLHRRAHITPRAEALLYAADRAHHVATIVRPAVERGEIIIQDRYLDSSVAYQGAGRELEPSEVRSLSLWAAENLLPDLTILLDIDENHARRRLDATRERFDRLEAEADQFHKRVREAYLELAGSEPRRFLIVNASDSVDDIAAVIRPAVENLLGSRPLIGRRH